MGLISALVGGLLISEKDNAISKYGNELLGPDGYDKLRQIKNRGLSIINNSHGNIVNLVSDYAVEPLIIVTESAFVLPSEIVNNGCNSLRDLFTSYYIRAFNIIITNMGLSSIDAIRILSSNNRRDKPGATLLTLMESAEDNRISNIVKPLLTQEQDKPIPEYDVRYINGKKYLFSAEDYFGYYSEADNDNEEDTPTFPNINDEKIPGTDVTVGDAIDTADYISSKYPTPKKPNYNSRSANINDAYGDPKSYNAPLIYKIGSRYVELSVSGMARDNEDSKDTNGKKEYNIKIEISGKVIRCNINHLKAYITPKLDDNSFSERIKKWWAGAISFKEFIFANDLVNDYKKLKAKQPTPINYINDLRQISAIKSMSQYGIKGVQANYNMVMITKEELKELCRFTNGVITRYDDKDALLEKLNAICILELDVANELAIFHIYNEYAPITLTFKDLKKKGDDKLEIKDLLETMAKANTRGGLI